MAIFNRIAAALAVFTASIGLTAGLPQTVLAAQPLPGQMTFQPAASPTMEKIQAFNDILDAAVETVSVLGENVDVTERFTYLGSDIHASASCEPEVRRRLGRARGAFESLDQGVWHSRYLCKRTKVRVFRALVLPVLLYGCETWTLTIDLRRSLNSFGTKSLRKILGYRWSDFVPNDRLLREAGMRSVTCIIRERQLRHFGHVARFPQVDPAHRILSLRDPRGWRRPVGRPYASWLQQAKGYFEEGGMGQWLAWGRATRRPKEYRAFVDAATRCSGVCHHTLTSPDQTRWLETQ